MPTPKAPPGKFVELGPYELPGLPSRKVRAYVPGGTRASSPRPALYMFDGQNVFEDEPSFAGGWHLHQLVEKLDPRRAVAPVVIGIEHGGEKRMEELAPYPAMGRPGRADELLDWVVGTVVPDAQRELPIETGPVGAAIGGSSMGGLGALYAHYRHPDVFGGAICMSSAFLFGQKALFEFISGTPKPEVSRIYIDCGEREAGGRMFAVAERMVRLLERKGYGEGDLLWRPDPHGTHNEQAWRRRAPRALSFMFRR